MRRLLVVSDLYPGSDEPAAGAQEQLPQLPALSQLLHLGRPGGRHHDWRAGLAADMGVPALAEVAVAQVAACAVAGLLPGGPVCMADPVHLVAGMASVHMHPSGLLSLDDVALAWLQDEFAREFGASHQQLHVAGGGMLLACEAAAAACESEPARLLGSPIETARSPDPALRALRRLGAEVEMWLAGLALNRDREHRGQLPVSALWFWGGGAGALPEVHSAALPWSQAFGADAWLQGCWKTLTGSSALLATRWEDLPDASSIVVASAARNSPAGVGTLSQLEEDWFAPALRDLDAGRLSALTLRIGGRRWDLGSRPRTRWLRRSRWWRSRPWWQVLTA